MNPFSFSPRTLTSPSQAKYVLDLYDGEIAGAVTLAVQLEENLNAIAETFRAGIKSRPEIESDLDLLIENAKYVGHSEGNLQNLNALKSQFRSALPYALKKQL